MKSLESRSIVSKITGQAHRLPAENGNGTQLSDKLKSL